MSRNVSAMESFRVKGRVIFLLLAALSAAMLLAARPAQAAPNVITVDRSDDPSTAGNPCTTAVGDCSLRGAIAKANRTANDAAGPDEIRFNIPASIATGCVAATGVCTVSPVTELPLISQPVKIDGYTQPGASPNTATDGSTNAAIKIVISGAGAPDGASGLTLGGGAGGTTIRGLAINAFKTGSGGTGGRGIFLVNVANNTENKIEGNFIGTDAAGTAAVANGGPGVIASGGSTNNTIGGTAPATRNLISGNTQFGIAVSSDANTVRGNLIGTDRTGTAGLGNGFNGVAVSANGNTVSDNHVAFNGINGVLVSAGTGNRILSNFIHDNGGLGINLGTDGGGTPNDRKDPDVGANGLQNFPIISSVVHSSGTTTISGILDSRPKKSFTIQLFANPAADPSEGRTFLGQKTVKTNRKGKVSFSFVANEDLSGQFVTATATNEATGDTSEFSGAVPAS